MIFITRIFTLEDSRSSICVTLAWIKNHVSIYVCMYVCKYVSIDICFLVSFVLSVLMVKVPFHSFCWKESILCLLSKRLSNSLTLYHNFETRIFLDSNWHFFFYSHFCLVCFWWLLHLAVRVFGRRSYAVALNLVGTSLQCQGIRARQKQYNISRTHRKTIAATP